MKKTVLAVGVVLAIAPGLFAETPDITSWFRAAPVAARYAGVQPDVERVFDDAGRTGLPLDLLMDRLRQGAAKGVAGAVLVEALRVESDRLSQGQDILQRQGVFFPVPADRDSTLKTISLSLMAGVSARTVESVFTAARVSGRSPVEATSAIETLLQADLSRPLPDAELQMLGSALMKSRMPPASFTSVVGFLASARAPGLSDEQVVDRVIAAVLDSSGGPLPPDGAPPAPVPGGGSTPGSSHQAPGKPAFAGPPADHGRPANPGAQGQGNFQGHGQAH